MSSKLLAVVSLALFVNSAAAVPVWGQCGGEGWGGSTTCDSGSVCTVSNQYYSQCIPGSNPNPNPTTAAPPTTPTTNPTNPGTPSANTLDGRFKRKGKKYWGAATDANGSSVPANEGNVIKAEFGQSTPANSMKWDATERSRGSFSFGGADVFVNWAVANGKQIRGHTLLWHAQLPAWVSQINDKAALTTVIQNHVAAVAGRYRGKLYAWDVVNEIFEENGSLRNSVFSRVLGESFVAIAFQACKTADPTAIRYINDYNLDSNNAKTQGMVALVKRVNAANPGLIQGLGTQMHLGAGGAAGVQAALTALASAGTGEVAITELDIANAGANDYVTVAKACLNTAACVGITSWGVSDANSWRSESNPLLFDRSYQKKAAYNAIMAALA